MMVVASIIGGPGYVGGELIRLIQMHPHLKLGYIYSKTHKGKYVHTVHPNLRGIVNLTFTDKSPLEIASSSDVVFLALPHGQSCEIVPKLTRTGCRIVDVGADFRLKNPEDYEYWYHFKHPSPELLREFIYGLPELHFEELKNAKYASVPGCTATCAILSLAPLAKEGFLKDSTVIIDSKVGSSGSGGKPSPATHFSERYNVVRIYRPSGHRHTPEIAQELAALSGGSIRVEMSTHAVNMVRGMETTSHVISERRTTIKELWQVYRRFYQGSRFIRVVRDLQGKNRFPDPKFSIGSNFVDVGFDLDQLTGRIVAIGALDNLVKGAAGNALQCANIMMGLDETEGLLQPPLYPV